MNKNTKSTKNAAPRIGVLGGTFDPPHNAHVALAREAYSQCALDLLYIMPAGVPVYKLDQRVTPAQLRLEMCKLAFEGAGACGAGACRAGARDAGARNACARDAGAQDACAQDAGAQDAGARDAGAQDFGARDAGARNAENAGGNAGSEIARDDAVAQGAENAFGAVEPLNIKVSDAEIVRGGKTYTAHTLLWLHEQNPHAQLFFVVGADAAVTVPKWRDAETIARLTTIVVEPKTRGRGSDAEFAQLKAEFRTMFLDAKLPCVSSSQVREFVRAGKSISGLLPASVEEYILKQGLYL